MAQSSLDGSESERAAAAAGGYFAIEFFVSVRRSRAIRLYDFAAREKRSPAVEDEMHFAIQQLFLTKLKCLPINKSASPLMLLLMVKFCRYILIEVFFYCYKSGYETN